MGDLSGVEALKKTDSLSSRSRQFPIVLKLGFGLPISPLPASILSDLTVCGSCVYSPRQHEFMCAKPSHSPSNTIMLLTTTNSSFDNIPVASSVMTPEACQEGV